MNETDRRNFLHTRSIILLEETLEGFQRTIPYSNMRRMMAQYSTLSRSTSWNSREIRWIIPRTFNYLQHTSRTQSAGKCKVQVPYRVTSKLYRKSILCSIQMVLVIDSVRNITSRNLEMFKVSLMVSLQVTSHDRSLWSSEQSLVESIRTNIFMSLANMSNLAQRRTELAEFTNKE